MKAGGSFERRIAWNQPSVALGLPELLERLQRRPAFEQEGDQQHDIGNDRRNRLFGVGDVDDAFVDRHARAEREDQHRDDEAPEIKLAPVTEGMKLVGRPLRRAAAPHQQQLVGRIDHAVNAFGEHRRRAGDRRRDELRDGDAEVGEQRDDERPRRGRVSAHRLLTFQMSLSHGDKRLFSRL